MKVRLAAHAVVRCGNERHDADFIEKTLRSSIAEQMVSHLMAGRVYAVALRHTETGIPQGFTTIQLELTMTDEGGDL